MRNDASFTLAGKLSSRLDELQDGILKPELSREIKLILHDGGEGGIR
jgi:hypothetical protein